MLSHNFFVLAALSATFLSCTPYNAIKATDQAEKSTYGALGADGSCSVSQESDGALISCPDGSMAFVPNGTNGIDGKDGVDGRDGANGADGINGADGSSCTVQDLGTKALLSCDDGTMAIIEDGADGQNGEDGQDGQPGAVTQYPLINIINTCTDKGSKILLQFANGDIIGSYAVEQKYLMIVAPGMSQIKNETSCKYSVTSIKK